MNRYLVAFKLNNNSATKGQKEQVKTFEVSNDEDVRTFVAGLISSSTRDLVSVSLHNFVTHETVAFEPEVKNGKLVLVKTTTDGGDVDC